MYFPAEVTSKTVLFFAVFTPWAIAFVGAATGAKTLNLRIGFDLNQGKAGAPSLRIRDLEGSSELNPRAGEEAEAPKTVIRADSISDSNEKEDKVEDESLSKADSGSSDDDDASGPKHEFVNVRSTKGIRPGEYEPDDNGGVHGRYQEDEDVSNDDARRKRYKREAKNYGPSKRKGKKVRSIRKQISASMEHGS